MDGIGRAVSDRAGRGANGLAILALDLGTTTGWALRRKHGTVLSGQHLIADKEPDNGRFYDLFDKWLSDVLTTDPVDVLIFEAPILRGGKTSIQTARRLMGLASLADLIGYRRVRRVFECDLQTVKKHFAGHGHADKPAMIAAARALGFDPEDDNEADALGVLSFACKQFKQPEISAHSLMGAVKAARTVA